LNGGVPPTNQQTSAAIGAQANQNPPGSPVSVPGARPVGPAQ
jgi:hypothetical protein